MSNGIFDGVEQGWPETERNAPDLADVAATDGIFKSGLLAHDSVRISATEAGLQLLAKCTICSRPSMLVEDDWDCLLRRCLGSDCGASEGDWERSGGHLHVSWNCPICSINNCRVDTVRVELAPSEVLTMAFDQLGWRAIADAIADDLSSSVRQQATSWWERAKLACSRAWNRRTDEDGPLDEELEGIGPLGAADVDELTLEPDPLFIPVRPVELAKLLATLPEATRAELIKEFSVVPGRLEAILSELGKLSIEPDEAPVGDLLSLLVANEPEDIAGILEHLPQNYREEILGVLEQLPARIQQVQQRPWSEPPSD